MVAQLLQGLERPLKSTGNLKSHEVSKDLCATISTDLLYQMQDIHSNLRGGTLELYIFIILECLFPLLVSFLWGSELFRYHFVFQEL